METKGGNIKECKNMLKFYDVLAQCVMAEYKTLLMKMTFHAPTNDKAKANFDHFVMCRFCWGLLPFQSHGCNQSTILLNLIMWNVFVCDFVVATKKC